MAQARPDARRRAREAVVQSLYETDLSGHDPRASLRVFDELVDWCTTHGVTSVADLTGSLEDPA